MNWIISKEWEKERLDKFLASQYPDKTRSHIKHWIDDGIVLVNNSVVKAGYNLRINDVIDLSEVEEKVCTATPQDIPIDIVYQDKDLAIINKEQGMVVHPAVKNYDNNSEITELNNQLKYIADSEKCEFCDISEKRVWNPQQIKDVSSFVYNIGFVHPLNNKRPLNNLVKMLFCINDLTP